MAKQDVTVELFYDDDWQDHTDDVLTRNEISITRGRADESGQPAPMTLNLSFTSWDFNPANPSGPLFGLIVRNTRIRVTYPSSTRFVGEVSSWTPRQSLGGDQVEPDRWVEVTAADITRRLGQGADPLPDAMLREVDDHSAALVGYWPLSDSDGATSAAAVIRGGRMRLSTNPEIASFDSLPSFGARLAPWLPSGLETQEDGSLEGRVQGAVAGDFSVNFVYRATRAAGGQFQVTAAVNALTDTPHNFQVLLDPGLLPRIQVIDSDGSTLGVVEGDATPEIFDGLPHLFRLRVIDASGDNVSVFLDFEGEPIVSGTVDIEQASLDPLAKLILFWESAGDGVLPIRLGQIIAWNVPTTNMVDAFRGRAGEHAGRRVERLCDEEGVPFFHNSNLGDLDDTLPVGPQYPDTLLGLLQEAAAVDGGIVTGSRVVLDPAVEYRPGRSMYSVDVDLELDYAAAQVAPPLDPVLDDQASRNDMTVSRRDGGARRRVDQASVDTVGRYRASVELNALSDIDLANQVGWRLHLGAGQGTRFPQLTVDLDANPELEVFAEATNVGDRIRLTNLPPGLSPDPVDLLVLGYTETIGSHRHRITFNCRPEEPFHIAEVEHPDYGIIGSDRTTVLSEFVAGTDTALLIDIPDSALLRWVHEGDFDILVGGVRLTVTAVAAFGSVDQEFTVVQAPVNGVVKTIPAGTPVDVFHKSYIGL